MRALDIWLVRYPGKINVKNLFKFFNGVKISISNCLWKYIVKFWAVNLEGSFPLVSDFRRRILLESRNISQSSKSLMLRKGNIDYSIAFKSFSELAIFSSDGASLNKSIDTLILDVKYF